MRAALVHAYTALVRRLPARLAQPRGWPALAALLWLLLPVAAPAAGDAAPREWRSAQVQVGADNAGWPVAESWRAAGSVALPDQWALSRPRFHGLVYYRVAFDAPDVPADAGLRAVYIERACSALGLRINGELLFDDSRAGQAVTRNCHRPLLVAVPAALLKPSGNELTLAVRGYALHEVSSRLRAGSLSPLVFGAYQQLAPHHDRRMLLAVRLPEVMSGTLALMGGFMFVMGWFNRKQSYLAYFGALMIGWSLLLARLWLNDLPLASQSAELLLAALVAFITLAAVQFLLRYAGVRRQWINLALPLQCVLMPATLLAAGPRWLYAASGIWLALLAAEATAAAAHYLTTVRRQSSLQHWLVAAMLALVGVSLLVELTAQWAQLDARIGYVAQLLPALVFLLLGLRLVQQYGRAYQNAEQSRAELEVRIRDATAQIERNFAQLAELKVEQVTERERKRIAADLHDDLGAKLLTIVHTSDSERISTLAREALEEMRLSVRGLTGKPVKLADALADWRAEVVSRLAQSGVQGEWDAPPDDDTPQTLSSRAYVQTTRILREAVSNVIKHSGASQCSVRASIAEGDFQLVIQDNGHGISVDTEGRLDKGHGMASMKGRAKQLQGQCLVESGPGYGTVIRLTLPLERHVTN